jgi:hypothetical protein
MRLLVFILSLSSLLNAADPTTLFGKVMCGY